MSTVTENTPSIYAANDFSPEQEAKVVDGRLIRDIMVDAQWTSNIWEDGVPVTKMFRRNGEIPLPLCKGTRIHGVAYNGVISGQDHVDFYIGNVWYSVCGDDAYDILSQVEVVSLT